jgi:hypothetical protein
MYRILVLIAATALAVSVTPVAAQNPPVVADGSTAVANDDGTPHVTGAGSDQVYGDINTGGDSGEVLGDASAVSAAVMPDHPGPGGGPIVMPGAGDGLIGGVPIQVAATGTTTTNPATAPGAPAETVPVESAPVDGTAAAPTDTAPTTGFCAQYTTWYDAQVAYENLGATAADPALVQEVDPNYDGIACEAMMA